MWKPILRQSISVFIGFSVIYTSTMLVACKTSSIPVGCPDFTIEFESPTSVEKGGAPITLTAIATLEAGWVDQYSAECYEGHTWVASNSDGIVALSTSSITWQRIPESDDQLITTVGVIGTQAGDVTIRILYPAQEYPSPEPESLSDEQQIITVVDPQDVEQSVELEEEDQEDEYDMGYVEYYLTVSSSDGGTVTWPGEDTFHYLEYEVVDLVAEADEGYQFERWQGGVEDTYSPSTTIRIYGNDWVTAYFIPIPLFELRSDDFDPEDAIPTIHSRWGGNVSPELHWTDAPSDAVSFILIMKDPVGWDGTGCVHWIVFNIPADTTSLAHGASSNLPEGAIQGTGDDDIGYVGCEPLEGQLHEYHFTIYALDIMLDLSPGADEQTVLAAMEGHIIDQAELVGTYHG